MTPATRRIVDLVLVLAGVAFLAAAAAGCRMEEPFDIPLLLEHEPQPDREDDTIPILFSGWESQPAKDELRAFVLWPAFHYVREGRSKELSFFGLPFLRTKVDHRGFADFDLAVPPVFYGHSADEGTYLTVFPFGGTMRGLLGKDYALGILFPLFLYTEDKAFKSTHVLWPIVNVWHGGGHSGFRVFPFYAHYERADPGGRLAFRRTWILWPFWQTLENNLNSPSGAQRMWFLFPFYGTSDGPDTHQWTVLFPFFKYFENRGAGLGGPLWELRAPWPFVRILRGRDRRITDIWPFFGVKERGYDTLFGAGHEYYRRRFILWPIWRDEQHSTGDLLESRWWALPLLWNFESENRTEHWSTHELKLWPLFRYKRWKDGRVALNVISPLWFEDPEGAFERIYGPLTRVYHEWRDEEGARRLEVLYGLYGERQYDARDGEDVSRVSLLFGLFQYERRGKKKMLRFFYLPTGPEWGEGAAPARAAEDDLSPGVGGERTPG